MPLTITALASWCDGDDWIDGLPVADASPMLFRMGRGDYVRPVADPAGSGSHDANRAFLGELLSEVNLMDGAPVADVLQFPGRIISRARS